MAVEGKDNDDGESKKSTNDSPPAPPKQKPMVKKKTCKGQMKTPRPTSRKQDEVKAFLHEDTVVSFKTCDEYDSVSMKKETSSPKLQFKSGLIDEGAESAVKLAPVKSKILTIIKSKWTKSPFEGGFNSANRRPKTSAIVRANPKTPSRRSPGGITNKQPHAPPRPGSTVKANIQPCFGLEGACVSGASMVNKEEVASLAAVKMLYLKNNPQVSLAPVKQGKQGKGRSPSPAMPPPFKVVKAKQQVSSPTPEMRLNSNATEDFIVKADSEDGIEKRKEVVKKVKEDKVQKAKKEMMKVKTAAKVLKKAAMVQAKKIGQTPKLATCRTSSSTSKLLGTSKDKSLSTTDSKEKLNSCKSRNQSGNQGSSQGSSASSNCGSSFSRTDSSSNESLQKHVQKKKIVPKTPKSRGSVRQSHSKETIKENLKFRNTNSKVLNVKLPKAYASGGKMVVKFKGDGGSTSKKH